jgi:membrane protein YdbS with pleckstrin-like domain
VNGLAEIADGQTRRLDPRYIDLQKRIGIITSLVLFVIATLGVLVLFLSRPGLLLFGLIGGAAFGFVAFLTWFMQVWPPIEYRHLSYRVDAAGLEIQRGVYFRHAINVPRSRIQHTDVSQGPLERQYGLGTLAIHTAGTEHARVELAGLPHDTALAIRDHLLPRDLIDAI